MKRSAHECVRGEVCVDGFESFRSMLKRVCKGPLCKLSPKRLQRHVNELAGPHSIRDPDTIERMKAIAAKIPGKGVRYSELAGMEAA